MSQQQPPNTPHLEIDHRTIKLLVGLISLGLAPMTAAMTGGTNTSVSESYWYGGLTQGVFIGSLFAIAAFMFSYNGFSLWEMGLSKLAALAAVGIALFPCECGGKIGLIPCDTGDPAAWASKVHYASATIMFLILTIFCFLFRLRALEKNRKQDVQAGRRAFAYLLCGVVIAGAIVVLLIDLLMGHKWSAVQPRLTFYGEAIALMAFGASWFIAGRVLPILTSEAERYRILSGQNPPAEKFN